MDGRLPFRAAVRPHLAVAYRLGRRERRVRSHAQARRQCDQGNRGYDGAAARLQVAGRLDGRGQHQVSGASGGRHALPDACQIPRHQGLQHLRRRPQAQLPRRLGQLRARLQRAMERHGVPAHPRPLHQAGDQGHHRRIGARLVPRLRRHCRQIYVLAQPDQQFKSPDVWEDFLNPALPIAERQILYAGYRLAHVLNELFG